MKLLVFPQGWFTASESKIPSATLMSLVKQGLLKIDSSTKPNKYLVNSNSTDIFELISKYDESYRLVLSHSNDCISFIKRKNNKWIATGYGKDGLFEKEFTVCPFVRYIHVYKNGNVEETININ